MADLVVLAAAVLAVVGLAWFFFAPRRAHTAELSGGVQRVRVKVAGGYSPDVIRVRQGVPVEITFDRQEAGECTSQVVFPDLRVSAALPAYAQTLVRLRPEQAGTFGFACGMNMVHGRLVVEAASGPPAQAAPPVTTRPAQPQRGAAPD
ncbi:MAG: cupredoxin domain-containing protein, partial [Micromonosporaceae bacterium]|nr:cupredoxin domain-containing protein [Micromonosporaceae bacterium]